MRIPLTSPGSEAWVDLKLHDPPARFLGKENWRYIDQISPRLLPWFLEFILNSELRIKYAEPSILDSNNSIFCIDPRFPTQFFRKSLSYLVQQKKLLDCINLLELIRNNNCWEFYEKYLTFWSFEICMSMKFWTDFIYTENFWSLYNLLTLYQISMLWWSASSSWSFLINIRVSSLLLIWGICQ